MIQNALRANALGTGPPAADPDRASTSIEGLPEPSPIRSERMLEEASVSLSTAVWSSAHDIRAVDAGHHDQRQTIRMAVAGLARMTMWVNVLDPRVARRRQCRAHHANMARRSCGDWNWSSRRSRTATTMIAKAWVRWRNQCELPQRVGANR